MSAATTPAPALGEVPVVGSFAVAAQLRMTTTGTTARLSVALPEQVNLTPATLVPALLSLGQQVLADYRLTGHELPEVDVTAVERVETVPATATGFTLGVINDLAARCSAIAMDSDLLLGNDDGVLLIAATLLAGAEHLLDAADHPTYPATPTRSRSHRHRGPRSQPLTHHHPWHRHREKPGAAHPCALPRGRPSRGGHECHPLVWCGLPPKSR